MRNSFKTLCIFVTAITLSFSFAVAAFAFPADVDDVPYEKAKASSGSEGEFTKRTLLGTFRLVKYLGITNEEESIFDCNEPVTKAYAAQAFALMSNGSLNTASEALFSDVPLDNQYANGIYTALNLGIVNEDSQKFYPNKKINISEIVQMALCSINRDFMLGKKSYVYYANQLGILKNINISDENITKGDFLTILENVLNSSYVEINGVNKHGEPELLISSDKSVLNVRKNIYKGEGVVTGCANSSTYGDIQLNDGKIEIDKSEYRLNYVDISLVGMYSDFYVDRTDNINQIIDLWVDASKNNTTAVDGCNLKQVSSDYISYEIKNSKKQKSVSPKAPVIYNNVFYGNYETAVKNGIYKGCDKIILISNNNSSTANVVKIEKYTFYVVKSASEALDKIIFKYSKGDVTVNDENSFVSLSLNGKAITVSDVKDNDVLSVLEANTLGKKRVFDAVVTRMGVTGIIGEISSDEAGTFYVIEDTKYYLTDEYIDYLKNNTTEEKPDIGEKADFYISFNDKIVFSSKTSDFSYAFVMAVKKPSNELQNDYQVQAYTSDGSVVEYYLDDKLIMYNENNINGKKESAKNVYSNFFATDGSLNNDAIAYKLNADKKITQLAFPVDRTSYKAGTLNYPLTMDYDFFSKYKDENGRAYRGILGRKYSMSNTPIIVYPGDTSLYNDKKAYSARLINYWQTEHYFENERLRLYNVDNFYVPSFAMMNGESGEANVDSENHMFMISDIFTGLNDDGDAVLKIEYYSNGGLKNAVISDEVEIIEKGGWINAPLTVEQLKKGDIFQFNTDSKGEISALRMLFSARNPPNEFCVETCSVNNNIVKNNVSYDATNMFSYLAVMYGTVKDAKDSFLLFNASASGLNEDLTGPLTMGHSAYGSAFYTLYDGQRDMVTASKRSEIQTGDKLVVRKYYNHVMDVFIIR